MLELNLKRIFKARGIDMPYKFLVKNGFVPFTAHKYKNGKVEHMRLDHIEKLCILLNCTPNEMFEWTPDDLLDDRKDNPLQKIRKREKKLEISKILNRMSLEKLEEIEKMLQTEAPPAVEGELRIPKTKRAKAKIEDETAVVTEEEPAVEAEDVNVAEPEQIKGPENEAEFADELQINHPEMPETEAEVKGRNDVATENQEPQDKEDLETFEDVADAIIARQQQEAEKEPIHISNNNTQSLSGQRKPLKRRKGKENKAEGLLLFPDRDE